MAILIGCTQKQDSVSENQLTPTVRVAKAKEEFYQPQLNFAGTLHPYREANCGSVLPGKVEKIHVKEGQKVSKNELLAELSGELLAQAEIEYATYKKDLDRVTRLHAKGSISDVDYEHLKAETEAKYKRLQMIKKNTEIRAPFAGTITQLLVQEGENYLFHPALDLNYSHASGVIRLMQLDKLKIEVEINEQDLNKIHPGMQAKIAFPAFPEKHFIAIVESVSPTLSHLTRTATATLIINNPDERLKPGMFCSVTIPLPSEKLVMIPRSALIQISGTGEYYVFTLENSRAVRKAVAIIAEIGEKIAVRGLTDGMQVITAGKQNCNDGTQVSILTED
jgi:membrane fusion protein (multidrug efflux system)